jgi:hypothetical protein
MPFCVPGRSVARIGRVIWWCALYRSASNCHQCSTLQRRVEKEQKIPTHPLGEKHFAPAAHGATLGIDS